MRIFETDKDFYDYCIERGYTAEKAETETKNRRTMLELYFKDKEPRDILTSTYKRAVKRQETAVLRNMGFLESIFKQLYFRRRRWNRLA